MARLPYVDPLHTSQSVQATLARLPPLNLFRVLAHAETAFEPTMRLGGAILGQLKLDPKLRELAILLVAKRAQAEYEYVQHVELGRIVGVTEGQIEAIDRGEIRESAVFSELERAVLTFTSEVLDAPRVSNATFAAVSQTLSSREIVELLLTIGTYLMLARVMTTLEIEIDSAAGSAIVDAAPHVAGTDRPIQP